MRFQEFTQQQADSFSADTAHELANAGSWSQPIPLDRLIGMLRGETNEAQPAPTKGMPNGRYCGLLIDTLKKHPAMKIKLAAFLEAKLKDHMSEFGSKDVHFSGKGSFSGYKHAHLTHDISIIYRVHGNPPTIDLYGLFRHDESGTGTPPNMNLQKTLAKKLARQEFEPVDQNKFTKDS